jgi:hypothetical protein
MRPSLSHTYIHTYIHAYMHTFSQCLISRDSENIILTVIHLTYLQETSGSHFVRRTGFRRLSLDFVTCSRQNNFHQLSLIDCLSKPDGRKERALKITPVLTRSRSAASTKFLQDLYVATDVVIREAGGGGGGELITYRQRENICVAIKVSIREGGIILMGSDWCVTFRITGVLDFYHRPVF